MTAAPGNDHTTNQRTAAIAVLPFAAVDAMVLLILSRVTIAVNEIGDGRSAQFDSAQKNLLQRLAQLFHMSCAQAIPGAAG